MSAREVIAVTRIPWDDRGNVIQITDQGADVIIAALRAAGYEIVPREATRQMLHDGANVLTNSQPHNGTPELAVFPVYEIWAAMLAASSPPDREQMRKPDMTLMGWQPPETAPRTGHTFLITTAGPQIDLCYFEAKTGEFRDYFYKQKIGAFWPYMVAWRPLDEPAKVGNSEAESRAANGWTAQPLPPPPTGDA